jgi:hypothetical protein
MRGNGAVSESDYRRGFDQGFRSAMELIESCQPARGRPIAAPLILHDLLNKFRLALVRPWRYDNNQINREWSPRELAMCWENQNYEELRGFWAMMQGRPR